MGLSVYAGAATEMDNILQEIKEMQVPFVETSVNVKDESDVDGMQKPRVMDIDRECAMQLQTELVEQCKSLNCTKFNCLSPG